MRHQAWLGAVLVMIACRGALNDTGNAAGQGGGKPLMSPHCDQGSTWLRDQGEVARLRGIDLMTPNFQLSGCRTALATLTSIEEQTLVDELDRIFLTVPHFHEQWRQPAFRARIARVLNARLGRHVVDDWAADLAVCYACM